MNYITQKPDLIVSTCLLLYFKLVIDTQVLISQSVCHFHHPSLHSTKVSSSTLHAKFRPGWLYMLAMDKHCNLFLFSVDLQKIFIALSFAKKFDGFEANDIKPYFLLYTNIYRRLRINFIDQVMFRMFYKFDLMFQDYFQP